MAKKKKEQVSEEEIKRRFNQVKGKIKRNIFKDGVIPRTIFNKEIQDVFAILDLFIDEENPFPFDLFKNGEVPPTVFNREAYEVSEIVKLFVG